MISSIVLKFTENADLNLPTSGITVFVGPNNSGKSLVLKELEMAYQTHPFPTGLKILKDYEVAWPSIDELNETFLSLEKFAEPNMPVDHVAIGRITPGGGLERSIMNKIGIIEVARYQKDKNWWATQFLRWGVLRLDGRSRFNLTNDQSTGDLLAAPQNVLAHLFQDETARAKVRSWVFDAFQKYFVVDPTSGGTLRIRLSDSMPLADEQSLNLQARDYHREATYIKDASDGVQAFTGIATAVLSGEYHTILIDEPEAFLHPPLAKKLGKQLATSATERNGALMASTHSADFLMGCVQASKAVRVVRLEYFEGKSRGRMVDPTQLETLFKRPLLRSTNVISGLFYDGVVVTESDNDRAFYAEIFHRLTRNLAEAPSVLFINAQNKQTIRDVVGPLRQFGVPAVAIPDIDIIKDGGSVWTGWLNVAHIPNARHGGLATDRASIKALFEGAGHDMKLGGVRLLDGPDKDAADALFDALKEYGIFVVRTGELERWLPAVGAQGKKTDWVVDMLERLGSDPADAGYVHPAQGDVWDFMRSIVEWMKNPARRGMP